MCPAAVAQAGVEQLAAQVQQTSELSRTEVVGPEADERLVVIGGSVAVKRTAVAEFGIGNGLVVHWRRLRDVNGMPSVCARVGRQARGLTPDRGWQKSGDGPLWQRRCTA